MKELSTTGFMSNRGRQVISSLIPESSHHTSKMLVQLPLATFQTRKKTERKNGL